MKKLTLLAIPIAALMGTALQAQSLTGTWQGTLAAGPQTLRIVMKVVLNDDKPQATMYSIDQGGQPINASATSLSGSTVKIAVAAIGGTYEGKLSPDGNSITGTWTQGPGPAPLNLARATPETAWTIPDPLPPPKMMAADAKPSFEVATIKPAKPEERFSLLVNRSGMLNTTATSVNDLIKFAYNLHPKQIGAGPSWLDSERYDVSAKPDTPGIPSADQLKKMVQKLLEDRFALKFHLDKKELSVYAITVLKTGQKMTKNDNNPNGLPGFGGGPRGMVIRNSTMAEFAGMLQANILDMPVVDQTDLGAGRYDFTLKWTPDAAQRGLGGGQPPPPAAGAEDPEAPPDLFTAFQQQLGLKLQPGKAQVDVLVVDKVEKPSDN